MSRNFGVNGFEDVMSANADSNPSPGLARES